LVKGKYDLVLSYKSASETTTDFTSGGRNERHLI
jgi:hypothetical protein